MIILLFTLIGFLAIALLAVCFFWLRTKNNSARALERYSRIIDLEAEKANLTASNQKLQEEAREFEHRARDEHSRVLEQLRQAQSEFNRECTDARAKLEAEYQTAFARYQQLQQEVAVTEESLEDISFGLYKPHFTFQTPEEYKSKIETLRSRQREVVRQGKATHCPLAWTVNNSKAEGNRMIRLHSKLMLRAFNGECEAAVANIGWNNAQRMEGRIRKAFADINKMGAIERISITDLYFMLRVEELRMAQEYEQKRYEAREEQRRIREQSREDERTRREIDRALEASESDEERYLTALSKARDEATRAMGAKLDRLTEQIGKFESKLEEARRNKERAISRAQLTRSGFVYVISNIGSFGEKVFKIGMTRRLEPMDRIYELSGAAVPFPYDLHAMLYSDNAPALECELHRLFQDRRLNRVNARREFFHDVELQEIEEFVRTKGLSAQFLQIPEAREYRQTLGLRQQKDIVPAQYTERFPEQLFA